MSVTPTVNLSARQAGSNIENLTFIIPTIATCCLPDIVLPRDNSRELPLIYESSIKSSLAAFSAALQWLMMELTLI